MNFESIGNLVKLRYKLMWAKTRSRNGRIALFFSGYLLLVLVVVLLTTGGAGAGIMAVRTGKGYAVTAGVLGGLFVQALIATTVLGFGINAVFTDTELRRYPLAAMERRVARHFLGIADPFWILVLALELGLAVGLYLVGAAGFFTGIAVVLLFFVSNYVMARVLALLIERLVSRKGGSAMLLVFVILFALLPGLAGTMAKQNPHLFDPVLAVLAYTPPAGAAAAMIRTGGAAWAGLAIILVWLAGLVAALVALEKMPPRQKAVQATELSFEGPWERLGALFGPAYGPLVAQWLRYYSRNNRFRTMYPLGIPLVLFLVYTQTRVGSPKSQFATVLGCFAIVGFVSTAQFAVNQFGYLGGGFRRYFLLPADPEAILRSGSYAFTLLSAIPIPVAAVVLLIVRPVALNAAGVAMLVATAVMTLFLMHGLALWSTLLGPRRANFYASFGNDLSLAGNIVVIGGMITLLFAPRLIWRAWPGALVPEHWWWMALLAVAAAAFYSFSLGKAAVVFRARRERLLGVMEGRN